MSDSGVNVISEFANLFPSAHVSRGQGSSGINRSELTADSSVFPPETDVFTLKNAVKTLFIQSCCHKGNVV